MTKNMDKRRPLAFPGLTFTEVMADLLKVPPQPKGEPQKKGATREKKKAGPPKKATTRR